MRKFLFFNIMMKILLAVPFSSLSILHGNTTLWFGNCRQEKRFADVCMIPRPCHLDKPAIVIELKWDKSAVGAIEQIKEKTVWKRVERLSGEFAACRN